MAVLLQRAAELAAIDELIVAAGDGRGGLAVVEGPAGIGKSALLAAAEKRAGAAGLRVLSARGGEFEREFAFGVVRQLFEPLVAATDGKERERLFAGSASRGQRVVSGEVDVGLGAQGLFGVLHGLYWLTTNATETGPLMLCVDDLHWVDAPSLRFLAFLGRRIGDLPAGVVVAVRVGEPDAPEALLDEVCVAPGVRHLAPAPLGVGSVADVVREERPGADDQLCSACHAVTAGNPLYLRELLRSLTIAGPDTATEVWEMSVPMLGERVVRRIERLGDEAPMLARAMAVLGDGRHLEDAAMLGGLDEGIAARAAAGLVKIEVLASEDPFAFVHPLVRRSVYDQLSVAERDEAHAAAAGLLARRGAPLDEIAGQLLVVRPAASGKVVTTLRDAAAQARARAAPESAITYLRRALEEPPVDEERVTVLRELGDAEALTVDPNAIEHLAEAHAATEEPLERAKIALEYGRACVAQWDANRAASVFASAIAELEDRDLQVADQLRAELYTIRVFDLSSVQAVASEVLELPDKPRAGPSGPTLVAIKGIVSAFLGAPAHRVGSLARAALADGQVANASWNGSRLALNLLLAAEDFEAAGEFLGQALEAARERGDAGMLSATHTYLAWRARATGRLAEAAAESDQQVTTPGHDWAPAAKSVGMIARTFIFGTRVEVLLDQGRVDEAAQTLDQIGELGTTPSDSWPPTGGFVQLLATRANLRMAQGNAREAVEDFERVLSIERDANIRFTPNYQFRPAAALALVAVGETEHAREVAHEGLEHARAYGATCALGAALRAAGLVERDVSLLRKSVAILESSPARLEYARSLVELGAALRRANQRAAAREPLSTGLELAYRCDAQPVVDRALEELRAAGARPRRIVRSGVDALTASELRVTRMAAKGRTNPEIAQELYVSLKTVEMHLSRAYTKLDLSGKSARRQLAEVLREPADGLQ